MASSHRTPRMRTFYVVWTGQLISTLGSGLTAFAVGVWLYQQTGTVSPLAFLLLFKALPVILLSPLAGTLVDRLDKRLTMILSDSGAAFTTLMLALLFSLGRVETWHLYVLVALASVFETFQVPAFFTSLTLLVPDDQYGRASGLTQVARALADILAPMLAGVLMAAIRVQGVLLIDFVTFLAAVSALLLVRFPASSLPADGTSQEHLLLREIMSGFRYIMERPGLSMLLVFFVFVFFLFGFIAALIEPLVLSITSPQVLGLVLSVAGVGLLGGSLTLSAWGGPRRRINGVLGFCLLFGLCVAGIGLRPVPGLIALAAFGAHFSAPFVNGLNQAIWQRIVAESIQGRVFAIQHMATRAAQALAFILAGPLADTVCEPLMAADGSLAGSVGAVLGVGDGRGIGLIFVVAGLLMALLAVLGALNPRLRLVEGDDKTLGSPVHAHGPVG
ncbi:MAG: MFS transporter [Anaerolineae bacterium]|nr:MFS transporter [Anaerolineae bacterium]